MRVIKLESDVQYVAVVVGCELAVEDGSYQAVEGGGRRLYST